ncbi:hypothetical protein QBC40DRAFT_255533 [Triangularia verruculosa]|uniref:Uncharacterized protein n=1 Tax=Triangularia verruculosa TaxID=2587418 RepID=A0AAN7ATN7_9PEZI|nr:hypothetical protein QBC40DRAFT_255533 [Triangularia verruculosa]
MVSTRRTADFATGRSDSVAGGPKVSGRRRAVAGTAVQSKLAISPEAPEAPEASVPAPRGARTKVRKVTASSDVSAGRIVETGGEGDDSDDIDSDWLFDDDDDDDDDDDSDDEERVVFDEDEEAETHQESVDDKPPGRRVSFEPLPKALFAGPTDDTNVKSFQQLLRSLLEFHHSSALTNLTSKLKRNQSGVTLDWNV